MANSGILFVTAPGADYKVINRLLLHLRDWEYGEEETWDGFHVVSKKDPELFRSLIASENVEPTEPPCLEDVSNEWHNSTLEEIEAFVFALNEPSDTNEAHLGETSVFLLLDEKGLQDKTCIVGERRYDDETDERTDFFNKVRVPWEECQVMWANLNIANMNFDDFCDDEVGEDENHWYTWDDSETGAALGLKGDKLAMREDAIKKLEDEGKA